MFGILEGGLIFIKWNFTKNDSRSALVVFKEKLVKIGLLVNLFWATLPKMVVYRKVA